MMLIFCPQDISRAVLRNSVFGQTNHALFQKLVDIVIRYDLIDLAAHAVLMLELPSEPPAPELGTLWFISQHVS
jgi:hypothetical protein